MPDRGEIRATTDQMLTIIDALRANEERKRRTPLGSPEFTAIARSTAADARLAFRWAEMQLQMAISAEARLARGEMAHGVHLIDVTPRPIDVILANWREAQIRLEISAPGSPVAQTAADDIERLREEYQVAHDDLADEAEDLASLGGAPLHAPTSAQEP
jgi:hypothetical protein